MDVSNEEIFEAMKQFNPLKALIWYANNILSQKQLMAVRHVRWWRWTNITRFRLESGHKDASKLRNEREISQIPISHG